jgi:DNA ligase-associated metallophosphoesterase
MSADCKSTNLSLLAVEREQTERTGVGGLSLQFAGETLVLLPDRAVWYPSEEALFVADLHVGKEATFRAAGIPVPDIFPEDLRRLAALAHRLQARQLFILGDLIHARDGRTQEIIRLVANWRRQLSHVNVKLVRGNHDRRAGDPPAAWAIHCVDEPVACGRLHLRHLPLQGDQQWTLTGHLHPKYRLRRGPDEIRLPCFLRRGQTLVLPAFADFIDHDVIHPQPDDSIYVVADASIIQVQ